MRPLKNKKKMCIRDRYKNVWDPPEVTSDSVEVKNTFAFVYKDADTGDVLSQDLITFVVTNKAAYFDDDACAEEENAFVDVKLASSPHASILDPNVETYEFGSSYQTLDDFPLRTGRRGQIVCRIYKTSKTHD